MHLFGEYGLPWFTFLGHTFTKAEVIVLGLITIHVTYQVLKHDIPWDKRVHKYDDINKKKGNSNDNTQID